MDLEKQVKDALEIIRPALQNDGGDIEFVRMKDFYVYVRLKGACAGCEMSTLTLKGGVERMLQTNVNENIQVFNLPYED